MLTDWWGVGFESTYKELKRVIIDYKNGNRTSFESTYKELKLAFGSRPYYAASNQFWVYL